MAFNARVYQVMIISSGDVSKERNVIKALLSEWNTANAYKRKAVLLPVSNDTFTSPEQGSRLQDENEALGIRGCDLLIGVFWTKIGSPMGETNMDTLEEIKRFIATGKPALLYFSNAPVHLGNIDKQQYDKLMKFKEESKKGSFVKSYETITDLKNKLSKQLSKISIQHNQQKDKDPIQSEGDVIEDIVTKGVTARDTATSDKTPRDTIHARDAAHITDQTRAEVYRETKAHAEVYREAKGGKKGRGKIAFIGQRLTKQAQELLVETSQSYDGSIMRLPTLGGILIQVNRRSFVEEDKKRKVSSWEIALEDLLKFELVKDSGYKGEVYKITELGQQVANTLKES